MGYDDNKFTISIAKVLDGTEAGGEWTVQLDNSSIEKFLDPTKRCVVEVSNGYFEYFKDDYHNASEINILRSYNDAGPVQLKSKTLIPTNDSNSCEKGSKVTSDCLAMINIPRYVSQTIATLTTAGDAYRHVTAFDQQHISKKIIAPPRWSQIDFAVQPIFDSWSDNVGHMKVCFELCFYNV